LHLLRRDGWHGSADFIREDGVPPKKKRRHKWQSKNNRNNVQKAGTERGRVRAVRWLAAATRQEC